MGVLNRVVITVLQLIIVNHITFLVDDYKKSLTT
jgi:hypothetical protein